MNNFKYGSLVEFELYSGKKYMPIRGIVINDKPVFTLDCMGTYSLCYEVSLIDYDKFSLRPSNDRAFIRENPDFDEEAFERLPEKEKEKHALAHDKPGKLNPIIRTCEFSHKKKKPATVFYISGSHMKLISE